MSETTRLLRIKSLINRDMQSVRGRQAPSLPQAADGALQKHKEQLETQDLVLREKAQQQRQQRQLRHRQHLLAEAAQKTAWKEQKQKQEAARIRKEHAERQKIQQQMRITIPSPQEVMGEVGKNTEKNSKEKTLDLTTLVRQGPSPQQHADLSRKDARLYSPFAHTKPLRAAAQQSFVQSAGRGVLAFLLDPFLLLWRTIVWPYRLVCAVAKPTYRSPALRSPARQGRQGFADTIGKALLACWHFATAPLHLLAHAVIDPLGMFTKQPHNYPRLSPRVYARIFVQQIQRGFLALLRSAGHLAQMLGRFLVAPFLLCASVVLMPWRSLRYGGVRNVAGVLAESGARRWRRARIRSTGFAQVLQPRMLAVLRAQRENTRRTADATKSLVGSLVRKRGGVRQGVLSLWRTLEKIGRSLATLSRALFSIFLGRTGGAHKPFFERRVALARTAASPRARAFGKGDRREEDDASGQEEKIFSATSDRTGLFASSEHSLLEDFFASEEAEQSDRLDKAADKVVEDKEADKVKDKEADKVKDKEADKAKDKMVEDKEAVYRDMDNLRSKMEDGRSEPDGADVADEVADEVVASASLSVKSDSVRTAAGFEDKLFQDVEGLDEQARAKLLQRLTRRVEAEKLR